MFGEIKLSITPPQKTVTNIFALFYGAPLVPVPQIFFYLVATNATI